MNIEKVELDDNLDLDTYLVEKLIQSPNWQIITGENPRDSKFHVIIPAKNEEIAIRSILENLVRQKLPIESTLIIDVILNGTTDSTADVVEGFNIDLIQNSEYKNVNNRTIRCFSIEEKGKIPALNFGRHNAQSDILINIDADVSPTDNSLAKIYSLLKSDPKCAVASVLSRIANVKNGANVLRGMQEYYDAIIRDNGAIIGKFYAYKTSMFPDFPKDIMSNDTWLEFTSIQNYGVESVKFLGQKSESDVAVYYHATSSSLEYLQQLFRWESGFQCLMRQYPELWEACHLADRIEIPKNFTGITHTLYDQYQDIPFIEKILMFSFLNIIRKITRNKSISEKFGLGTIWTSPKSDRFNYE